MFQSLPGKTWPEGFEDYISRMESREPSDKWVKAQRLLSADPEARRMAYFSHRVIRAWEEGKRVINNTLNPIWKRVPVRIPSGVCQRTSYIGLGKSAGPTRS